MTKKVPWESWIAQDLEAEWCSGATVADLDGMHVIPEWEIKIPARKKEIVWAQDRDKPITTLVGIKDPVDIPITTKNVWSFRPLYLLLGDGSYTAVGSSGIISQNSGTVKSFAIHMNMNGNERGISGCAMDEVTLNIPEKGGNLTWEWKAKGADYGSVAAGTKPNTIRSSLRSDDGTYTFESGGNAIPDIFKGGKLTFKNNLNLETPDMANGRIYKPALGHLTVEFEGTFRIDEDNTYLRAWEEANTGIFDLKWDIKNSNNTGCVIDIDGFQLTEEGYTEKVPTAQAGIIEVGIKLVQSEDFVLNDIQVTGVDPT